MRTNLTRSEALSLAAAVDQLDAKLADARVEYTADDLARLSAFEAAVGLVVPLLYRRVGAERVVEFARGDGLRRAVSDWHTKYPPGHHADAEEYYAFFAAYLTPLSPPR